MVRGQRRYESERSVFYAREARPLEPVCPAPCEPVPRPDETKNLLPYRVQTRAAQQDDNAPATGYAISLTDAAGHAVRLHVAPFGSDIEACAAARRLMRPGERAIIMSAYGLVGQVSLALVGVQTATFAETRTPSVMPPAGDSAPDSTTRTFSAGLASWVERWFGRA